MDPRLVKLPFGTVVFREEEEEEANLFCSSRSSSLISCIEEADSRAPLFSNSSHCSPPKFGPTVSAPRRRRLRPRRSFRRPETSPILIFLSLFLSFSLCLFTQSSSSHFSLSSQSSSKYFPLDRFDQLSREHERTDHNPQRFDRIRRQILPR